MAFELSMAPWSLRQAAALLAAPPETSAWDIQIESMRKASRFVARMATAAATGAIFQPLVHGSPWAGAPARAAECHAA